MEPNFEMLINKGKYKLSYLQFFLQISGSGRRPIQCHGVVYIYCRFQRIHRSTERLRCYGNMDRPSKDFVLSEHCVHLQSVIGIKWEVLENVVGYSAWGVVIVDRDCTKIISVGHFNPVALKNRRGRSEIQGMKMKHDHLGPSKLMTFKDKSLGRNSHMRYFLTRSTSVQQHLRTKEKDPFLDLYTLIMPSRCTQMLCGL